MGPRHRHGNEPGKEQRGRIWTPRDEQAGGRALRSLGLPRQQCTGRTGDLWLRSQVDVAKSRQHDHEGEMGELTEPVPRRGPHVHPARGSETVGRVLLRLSLGRCSRRPVAGGSRRRPSDGTDGAALSSPRRTAFLPFQRKDTEAQHAATRARRRRPSRILVLRPPTGRHPLLGGPRVCAFNQHDSEAEWTCFLRSQETIFLGCETQ